MKTDRYGDCVLKIRGNHSYDIVLIDSAGFKYRATVNPKDNSIAFIGLEVERVQDESTT